MNTEPQSDLKLRQLALLLIVLLGATLRFYDLGSESLWLDEALSWQQASLPVAELMRSIAADVHPPLYALLLHVFISLFGDSEWALRLLSAISGTASVWLVWAVCRRIHSENAALIASLLYAVALFAIQYSQEARMYALMSCLALASMLMLLRISDGHSDAAADSSASKADFAGYLLLTSLLMYSHVYGLFVVIAQNIYMGLRYLPLLKRPPALPLKIWAWLQVILAVLFTPWLFVLAAQIARVQSSFWIEKPDLGSLLDTFVMYMGVMPALILAAIPAAYGLLVLFRLSRNTPSPSSVNTVVSKSDHYCAGLLILSWLLTPILIPFVISLLSQPVYMPRYTIASSPAWFILVAAGIASVQLRWIRYSFLALLLISMVATLPFYFSNQSKTDWPAVVQFISENAQTGDLVLFHNPDVLIPYRYYTTRDDLKLQTVVSSETWQAAGVSDDREPDVRELAELHDQLWLVSGYDLKTAISEIEILNQLAGSHQLAEGREFRAIRVFRFEAP